jgi:hypothetical protein
MTGLGRSAVGRFADSADPQRGFVPVPRLLEPRRLRDLILWAGGLEEHAGDGEAISEMDMTIAVSRFARQYCGAVSAAALVGLAHGIGIDMSPRRCSVALLNTDLPVTRRRFVAVVDLTADEVLRCAERPTSLPVTGPVVPTVDELRGHVWSRLFGAHYDLLFRRVRELMPKVSPVLLWTSAAEYAGGLSDAAEEHLTAAAAAPYVADRRALLEGETLPGVDGPSPLRDRIVWDHVGEATTPARRLCCLNYLLPERDGRLCENCPYLPPEDRLALVMERRDLPLGSTGGPADLRAREAGRSRPSYRQRHRLSKPRRSTGEQGSAAR